MDYSDALDIMRDVSELTDTDEGSCGVFYIYVRRAVNLIREYLSNPYFDNDYIIMNFPDAIIEMVVLAYRNKGNENIQAMTQGARSATFSDGTKFLITDNVKALLPKPKIKLLG